MLLFYSVSTLHVIVCIILVLVVLLQSGKGADLAGAFGGGATQTAFGSRGPASFLSKMTTIAAIIFMMTSIGLSLISTKTAAKSVLDGAVEESVLPKTDKPSEKSSDVPVLTPEQIKRRVEELQSRKQEQSNSQESIPAPAPETP
jgi:preprotein translocase subunit SecG